MSDSASPAVPLRRRSLRGLGPLSRDDLAANLGFADAAAEEGVADIMRPGALRGAARGRNLDSVAYTLFLRIYPVIAMVVLLTQAAIAWVNYNDQYRLYTERAEVMATLVAASIAQPGWNRDPARSRAALDALTRDPAFRYAALH
ncbi:serine/threonine protein phosphatase, partial [Methylobacterium sp. WL122]